MTSSTSLLRTKLRRDLGRQRAPFAAVACTMLIGVALFGAAHDAYLNLQSSYDEVFDRLRVADIWVTGGDTPTIAARVAELDGVEQVAVRVSADLPLRVDGRKLAGRIVGLGGDPIVNDVQVLSGAAPRAAEVLAENHLVEEFGLAAGTSVKVFVDGAWIPLQVSGAAASGEYLWLARTKQEVVAFPDEFGVLFAPDAAATAITGSAPNQVLVRTGGVDLLDDVTAIARAAGAADVYDRAEQPSNAALSEDIQGFSQMALLFPLLFLTAAGMASYTLLSRRIHAERAVIGMLRAEGVSRRTILRHYLGYGLVAGLGGAVPGALLGLGLARLMTDFYVGFLSLPVTATRFHPQTPLMGIAFGVVAGGLAAWAPARLAAGVPPAEAMRGIVPAGGGRRTLVERLIPRSDRWSSSTRLVVRSMVRNRRRTAMTATGVVLALLLVLVSWSMLDTIEGNLDRQFRDRDRSDARVAFTSAVGDGALDELAAVDGVARVEPLTLFPVTVSGASTDYATVLEAPPDDTTLRSWDVIAGRAPRRGSAEVVAGEAMQNLLDVEVGDRIGLSALDPSGQPLIEVSVTISGFVRETLGTSVFTTASSVASALGTSDAPVTAALLAFEEGADPDAVRRAVEALDVVASFQATDSLRELLDDATSLLVGFVALMLIVGGVLAATVIFTTASVSIAERTSEVATLRASGVPLRRIAGLITAENLLVTAIGVVPGLGLGLIGGRLMMNSYTTDQFHFEFIVSGRTIAASVGALFVVAAAGQFPGLRSLRRLDLAAAVRDRSA